MTIHARNASAIPAVNFSATHLTELRSRINAPQALAYSAALLLAVASATTNVSSAVAKHITLSGQFVAGSIALSVALLTLIALPAAMSAARARNFAASAIAAIVFALAASYSVTSALGVLGAPRLTASVTADHDNKSRARLDNARNATLAELATIAPARQASELNSLIASKLATSGANGCQKQDGPISTRICTEVAALQSEASRFDRISALSGTVARIDEELKALGRPSIANSDAAALVSVLETFGVKIDTSTINVALMLLAVAILEVGSGLSLAVAQSMRHIAPSAAPAIIEAAPVITAPAILPLTSGLAAATAERIKQLALASGGSVSFESKRKLATAMNASTGTACRALAILAAAGAVVSNADGILVRIAA